MFCSQWNPYRQRTKLPRRLCLSAFGGPASSRATAGVAALDNAMTLQKAHSGVRPASDELSLDSIFRGRGCRAW